MCFGGVVAEETSQGRRRRMHKKTKTKNEPLSARLTCGGFDDCPLASAPATPAAALLVAAAVRIARALIHTGANYVRG